MKKRLLSALLSMAVFVAMLPYAFASDLDGHWAKTYIEYLDREGVINPSATTGMYEPNRDMTRAEFMRYINRAFHFTETAPISYSDVTTGTWYYETIQIAQKYGYINGVGDNKMEPLGEITREQAAVIIGRLFKVDPGNVSPADLPFSDRNEVSDWSAGYIKAAADKGILGGYDDGTFQPNRVVTRAEVAKILYYYMGTSLSVSGKTYTGADLKTDTTNVTISESCTLSDATIQGDLYITEGLGSDAVTLTNVTVKGSVIVSGGTVTMMNTSSDHMIVSTTMGRLLQVTATGAARIGKTDVVTAAALYTRSLSDPVQDGFGTVTVNGSGRVSLTLDANVSELTLAGEATVSTTANTQVYHLVAQKAASVTGYGMIYQADIYENGVSFASSVTVGGYTMANGVSATISGQSVSGSSVAGVLPVSITVDLSGTDALGAGVPISVPTGLTVFTMACDGNVMSDAGDYVKTATGASVSTNYLTGLSKGRHTLTVTTSDGKRTNIKVTVSDSEADAKIPQVSFDRYYRSSGFKDVRVKLDGILSESDLQDVVLGMTQLEHEFDNAAGTLVLRRGTLTALRTGSYTVSVDLRSGSTRSFVIHVSDSTPNNVDAAVAEYDTDTSSEVSFQLPKDGVAVSSITVKSNGTTESLQAQTHYQVSARTVTLTPEVLEQYRPLDGGLVEFVATLSDSSSYTMVVDYIE